jgi:hypothetical protein
MRVATYQVEFKLKIKKKGGGGRKATMIYLLNLLSHCNFPSGIGMGKKLRMKTAQSFALDIAQS